MEEGHFDAQGNYIANKETDATDNWLESVDWKKVESKTYKHDQSQEKMDEDEPPAIAPANIMQDMIEIMKPGENVLKCLRRLGGNKKHVSSADRWKKKKQNVEEPVDEKAEKNKADLLRLTGLADDLLQGGDFQIYEKTYEQLKYEIDSKLSQFEDADEDDALETAFKKPKLSVIEEEKEKIDGTVVESDDDELEAAFSSTKNKTELKDAATANESEKKNSIDNEKNEETKIRLSDEVCWFYKVEDNDASELQGPFTSTVMLKMQEDGQFGDGVFCCKVGKEDRKSVV